MPLLRVRLLLSSTLTPYFVAICGICIRICSNHLYHQVSPIGCCHHVSATYPILVTTSVLFSVESFKVMHIAGAMLILGAVVALPVVTPSMQAAGADLGHCRYEYLLHWSSLRPFTRSTNFPSYLYPSRKMEF
jgi:hypothetical protein